MTGRLAPLRIALVAVAVLAGLLAMHGLTHHGEHLPGSTARAAAPADGHASDHHAPPAADDEPADHDPAAGAAMVCVAVLLGGLLACAAVRRPRLPLLARLPRVHRPPLPRRHPARDHDPPDRWALAVCRC